MLGTRPEHARPEHAPPEHAQPEHARKPRRWLNPLELTLGPGEINPPRKLPIFFAFALMAAGLLVALAPVRVDRGMLGSLAGPSTYVPTLCFLAGDVCLGAGVWAAISAARGRPLERLAVAGLGITAAALTGQCARVVLQILLLRRFYRPDLFFTSPARAAAVGWGLVLAVTVAAGFLGPLAVAAMNLLPRVLTDKLRPTRWLASQRWWLLLPFAALPLAAFITQWVLSPSMAAAMGYSYPAASGALVTVSLRNVGPVAWSSLQVLVALPLVVLMWEGVESARSCHRLVKNGAADTRLLTWARRIDYRLAAAVIVIAAAGLAAAHGSILGMLAGAGVLLVVCLSLRDDFGRVARLGRNFERGVQKWQLPREWRDLGRISLLLGVLALPVLYILGADIFTGVKEGVWFPSDLQSFYFYWRDYGLVTIPVVSASAIFGHTETVVWEVSLGLAAFFGLGLLIQFSKKDARDAWPMLWFLLRVGVLAFLFAPVARLADHSYATFTLTACTVVVVLVTFGRDRLPTVVWSAILAGGALALWSLALWRATWVPAAALVCLTILQRFVYNAGELNKPGKYRRNRIAYFQAVSLVAIGMLALGHGAAAGFFESEDLSSVSDRISLSVVAVIWLVILIAGQKDAATAPAGAVAQAGKPGAHAGEKAAADDAGEDDAAEEWQSVTWAWLLDPRRALVRFLGREDELAALLAWCEEEPAVPLRLVSGAGGIGKTRLAIQLAEHLAERGWKTRWIRDSQGIALPRGRALLVVDNADTCAGLKQMLTALAGSQAEGVRVLLLARSAGEWLDQLGIESPAVRYLVEAAKLTQLRLPVALAAGIPDVKITNQAVFSVAKEFGLRQRAETLYKTSAGRRPVLDLHAAALVATLTDADLAERGTGTVRSDIRGLQAGLDQLLGHEQQCWYEGARDYGLMKDGEQAARQMLRQIIAVCWLLGAATGDEASELAARVPGVSPSAAITEWLRDIFGGRHSRAGEDGYKPPSRLAELHVIRELGASPELARACLTGLAIRQARQAVVFLARASADYKEAASLLNLVLSDIADRRAELESPVETLTAILSVLPSQNASLAQPARDLNQQILDLLPAGTELAARAYWLAGLSSRLTAPGERADAVAAAQEAASRYGELAAASPHRYRPEHAAALDNLGVRLSELGRPDEARSATEAAVELYRQLAAADPGLHAPGLAAAIANLGYRYQKLGRTSDALSAAEEAVAAYREVDARRPGLYSSYFAFALTTLAGRYAGAGRPADAIPLQGEAIAIYRNLCAAKRGDFRPGLAGALDNLGIYLARVGRHADALTAGKEAVALYGQLRKDNPKQYRPGHAGALSNLSNRYLRLGRAAMALPPAKQAVAIYRELVATDPEQYRPKLAAGLAILSGTLKAADRKAEAETVSQEAEELRAPEHPRPGTSSAGPPL
jgi:tetratricopeptide (TPR) repeat protein